MSKKIFLITDTHFGVHPSEIQKWLNHTTNFFHNEWIPWLKEHHKPGDILIHIGDWYHNQNNINILVLNESMKILQEISSILPVYIIVGNHDIWGNSENEINSLKPFQFFPNVNIIETPQLIEIDKRKLALLPWFKNKDLEKTIAKEWAQKADWAFMHSDLVGCATTKREDLSVEKKDMIIKNRAVHGPALDDLKQWNQIWSGHIHIRQSLGNFNFIGCPYHLDVMDMSDEKGYGWIDVDSGKYTFFPNKKSHQYKWCQIDSVLDITKISESEIRSNWMILNLNQDLLTNPAHRKKIMEVLRLPFHDIKYYKANVILENKVSKVYQETATLTPELVKELVLEKIGDFSETTRNKMIEIFDQAVKIKSN